MHRFDVKSEVEKNDCRRDGETADKPAAWIVMSSEKDVDAECENDENDDFCHGL